MLKTFRATALSVAGSLLLAAVTIAQERTPEDPVATAPIRFGVVGLEPRFRLANLGIDTNVFNSVDDPQSDFTFTVSPALNLWLRTQRGLLSATGQADFVYFNEFETERAVNGTGGVGYEYRFNRLRPFVNFNGLNTRERPGYEIDIRARRFEHTLDVGIDFRVASKSFLEVAGHRTEYTYDGDAIFNGQPLNQSLNRTLEAVDLTWRQHLTVLTTWLLRVASERERFEFEASRNGDNARVVTGFEFGRLALIRGTALVGYRRLIGAEGGTLPEFSGMTADVDVSYSAPTQTRLSVATLRDLEYSYDVTVPYYIQTGWTATLTQRLIGRWDLQLVGGRDRLSYQSEDPDAERVDRIDRIGGGIGYQLGQDIRISLDAQSQQRQSVVSGHYKSLRAGLSVLYGF